MQPVSGPGKFIAKPFKWAISRSQRTSSIILTVTCSLTKKLPEPPAPAVDLSHAPLEAVGKIFLVKRDGAYNESACKTLIEVFGWGEDMLEQMLPPDGWDSPECRVEVAMDAYDQAWRIKWFNPLDRRMSRETTPEELEAIRLEHGAKIRAIGAAIKAGTTPPKLTSLPPSGNDIPF